jgi:hypothetical protein
MPRKGGPLEEGYPEPPKKEEAGETPPAAAAQALNAEGDR